MIYHRPTIAGWPITRTLVKKLSFTHTVVGWRYRPGSVWEYIVHAVNNPVEIEGIDYESEEDD